MNSRDVTARHRTIGRLTESEERYRLLAENSADILCHIRDGKFVWVSPSIEAALGAPPEYWSGWDVLDHIPPDDLAMQAALLTRAVAGETVRVRGRVIGADGVAHWLDLHAKPFYGADGHHDGVAATLRLVDDEVAAQHYVEEARRRLEEIRLQQVASDARERGVIDNSVVPTTIRDLEGRIERVNQAMCDLVGYHANALRQMTWQDITAPESLAAESAALSEMLPGGTTVYRSRQQYRHSDGRRIWVDATTSVLSTPGGESRGFVTQVLDITAQAEADERNRALAQELAQHNALIAASEERYRLLADDEVAAERAVEEARNRQAGADALYRRSVESSAVGMCLTTAEGRFTAVNEALCEFFGMDAETLRCTTWQQLTAPNFLGYDLINIARTTSGQIDSYRTTKQFIHADGKLIWGDVSTSCIRDARGGVERLSVHIVDITDEVEAKERSRLLAEELARKNEEIAASEVTYRLLVENAGDVVVHTGEDNTVIWVSPNVDVVLGVPADQWIGQGLSEFVPPEDQDANIARWAAIRQGGSFQGRLRIMSPNGVVRWCHALIKPFFDLEGHRDGEVASIRVVDDEIAAENAIEQARRERARADARFRRSMDNAAIGMCLLAPDGRFEEVNGALCQLFGCDAAALTQKAWQDLTAPEYLEDDLKNVTDILAGRTDSYRMIKQYIHAGGHRIWGDLSVSCVRDEDGHVENFISQITDITARVDADERNRVLAQQLQRQNDLTKAELDSAASYMKSIMPRGLTGPVTVSSRYLPSRELGGDCFDYTWIDDDHLVVYLIDVSGHGIEPALLSVSLHNILRSGTLTTEILLAPAAVLAELNRLFQMEQQRDHFFTIWYGVYERHTRTLRYASAGTPPAFASSAVGGNTTTTTELTTNCKPAGVFDDTRFTAAAYSVPPGCRILLFSDGASEIVLADGDQLMVQGLKEIVTRLAGSPDWTLDDLIDELRDQTPAGGFEDDCSLILLTFE